MFIILSSRIRIRVRIRGFKKNPSESIRLQDFEIVTTLAISDDKREGKGERLSHWLSHSQIR